MDGAVDVDPRHAQGRRHVDSNAALVGELSGDGGGDGSTVVAEADLEVGCAVGVDLVGGEDVSEALDGGGASYLAGAGDAGGVVPRVETGRRWRWQSDSPCEPHPSPSSSRNPPTG